MSSSLEQAMLICDNLGTGAGAGSIRSSSEAHGRAGTAQELKIHKIASTTYHSDRECYKNRETVMSKITEDVAMSTMPMTR